jgi:hypothetical protein
MPALAVSRPAVAGTGNKHPICPAPQTTQFASKLPLAPIKNLPLLIIAAGTSSSLIRSQPLRILNTGFKQGVGYEVFCKYGYAFNDGRSAFRKLY